MDLKVRLKDLFSCTRLPLYHRHKRYKADIVTLVVVFEIEDTRFSHNCAQKYNEGNVGFKPCKLGVVWVFL